MPIRSFSHAGLKRLFLADNAKGLPADAVAKLRKQLQFLQALRSPDALRTLPTWKAHRLKGDREGTWALHVTANWRLTFRITTDTPLDVIEVNLEDYH